MKTNDPLAAASVDQNEIDKFNQLAALWWDAAGPMWPLHTLNNLRKGYITTHVSRHFARHGQALPLSGLRILDIGCGGGLLSEAMALQGASVHGVDISDRNIAIAQQHAIGHANPPVLYELTSAEALWERGEQYDVVLNMEVVEHVADLRAFMKACNGVVRQGGLQVVSTINRNPVSWLSAIIAAEYILRWLPKGTHQYHRLVKPSELDDLLIDGGFETLAATGVAVNPLTRRMSLSRFKPIGYMVVAHKC